MGRGVVIRRAIQLATIKDIDEKRTMIGKNYGFFMVFDLISSLGNNWNCGSVLSLW